MSTLLELAHKSYMITEPDDFFIMISERVNLFMIEWLMPCNHLDPSLGKDLLIAFGDNFSALLKADKINEENLNEAWGQLI